MRASHQESGPQTGRACRRRLVMMYLLSLRPNGCNYWHLRAPGFWIICRQWTVDPTSPILFCSMRGRLLCILWTLQLVCTIWGVHTRLVNSCALPHLFWKIHLQPCGLSWLYQTFHRCGQWDREQANVPERAVQNDKGLQKATPSWTHCILIQMMKYVFLSLSQMIRFLLLLRHCPMVHCLILIRGTLSIFLPLTITTPDPKYSCPWTPWPRLPCLTSIHQRYFASVWCVERHHWHVNNDRTCQQWNFLVSMPSWVTFFSALPTYLAGGPVNLPTVFHDKVNIHVMQS